MQMFDGKVALALSGGNALGAFQAGAWEALADAGIEPATIAGASIGAVNTALIAGNAPTDRLQRLADFWRPAESGPLFFVHERTRRTAAAAMTAVTGRPGLFFPRLAAPGWDWAEPASMYDTSSLAATLARLVDFDRLNAGSPRVIVTAVDLENGEDVAFDSARTRIGIDQVRASGALLPVFPPVEVEGRWLGDPGISANLPLDTILDAPPAEPLLVIAVDLLPLHAPAPATLSEVAGRMQDLVFATQSRRAIAAWQRIYDLNPQPASVTLIHLAYADQSREVLGKAFDFSPETVAQRWSAGRASGRALVERLLAGDVPFGEPGLHTVAMTSPVA